MELELQIFTRKPFHIQAVRVTEENMVVVAKWCGGKIIDRPNPKNKSQDQYYVKVNVERPVTEKHTMAFIGNYVIKTPRGFKVYTKAGMDRTFDEVDLTVLEVNTSIKKQLSMPENFKKFLDASNNVKNA